MCDPKTQRAGLSISRIGRPVCGLKRRCRPGCNCRTPRRFATERALDGAPAFGVRRLGWRFGLTDTRGTAMGHAPACGVRQFSGLLALLSNGLRGGSGKKMEDGNCAMRDGRAERGCWLLVVGDRNNCGKAADDCTYPKTLRECAASWAMRASRMARQATPMPQTPARCSGKAFWIDSRFKERNLRHMTRATTDLQEGPQGAVDPANADRDGGDAEMDRGAAAHGHARTNDSVSCLL
jgi:hypothetical protein